MEAIILAGGMGKRLRSVITDLPKPMAPIAGNPFLWYLLSYLNKYPIQKAILSVGYRYEMIQAFVGKRFAGMEIDYAVEEAPLGTGGGIRLALTKVNSERVLILNGDTFFSVDFMELAALHVSQNADLTLALKPMSHFERYGNVITDGTRITGFEEKKATNSGKINGGVYLMNTNLLDDFGIGEKFSFENDFLEKYVTRLNFQGLISETYFIDIGVPEDYLTAQMELPGKVK